MRPPRLVILTPVLMALLCRHADPTYAKSTKKNALGSPWGTIIINHSKDLVSHLGQLLVLVFLGQSCRTFDEDTGDEVHENRC